MTDWKIKVGDKIKRSDLHESYGGRRNGRISPSTKSPNVMVFTSPTEEVYGYFDGWNNGIFQYTGEGLAGDQELKQGNRALLEHQRTGKTIRLFNGMKGVNGDVIYVGEFEIDGTVPFYTADAVDQEKNIRNIIIFRLRPVGNFDYSLPTAFEGWCSKAENVMIDAANSETEAFTASPSRPSTVEDQEAKLIQRYQDFLRREGKQPLGRLKIKPAGESQYLFTDLFDPQTNTIIEAKGTATRDSIRTAIGQLLDYSRFAPEGSTLAILLPNRPRQDLADLLDAVKIQCIYQGENSEFVSMPSKHKYLYWKEL